MGQLLQVVGVVQADERVLRIEVDRSLTGMGLEVYASADQASGEATSSRLANRLFACSGVDKVSIFSNTVTVSFVDPVAELPVDARAAIEDLFTHYLPGVEPTPI